MRVRIKASTITFIIAIAIIFFQVILFISRKALEEETPTPATTIEQLAEPESIKLLKDSLFMSTNPKNYSNFALQLSTTYAELGKSDSAARYKELSSKSFPEEEIK